MSNLRFGEFTIDRALRQLTRGQEVLPVYGKCFDLLVYMVDNPGRPLLKSELLGAVWPDTIVEEANLSQNVSQLRKVVGSGSDSPIVTLPGRGYQFAARVTELLPDAPSGATAPNSASQEALSFKATRTHVTLEEETVERVYSRPSLLVLGIVAASVCLVGVFAWFAWQRWLDHDAGSPVSVILTSMDGTTGDPVLDRTLNDALRIDLAQSPFVSPVSQSVVNATLTQMRHNPDDSITSSVAREVCERTNSQAVVHSTVVRSGTHFLLTEEASSCVDGKVLAQAKQEASKAEDLPHCIDQLAISLRHQLGESRRSVAHFDTPLFADNTASLNALKAETEALADMRDGKMAESIALFNTAIAEDPNYATAYYGLAAAYGTEADVKQERTAIAKAYSLKDSASRPVQLAITALYNTINTQDLYENLRNQKSWTQLYPRSGIAWNGLSNLQRDLGDYTDAVASSERATEVLPTNQSVMINLATGQLQSGDLKAARETCQRAIIARADGGMIHTRLLEAAYVSHDAALLGQEVVWADRHADAGIVFFGEARIAVAEGRFLDAQRLVARSRDLLRQQGVAGAGNQFSNVVAVEMMQAGDIEPGKRLFEQEPVDIEEGQSVVGLVYAGKASSASAALHAMQAKYPRGTLWNLYWGPLVHALANLAQHQPREAVAALEPSRPLEMRELFVPWLRGTAYLASGEPVRAEGDFRTVVTHSEVDPTAAAIPLSWLGLGRALAAQGKLPGAIEAYGRFLTLWSHADADAIDVVQARQELAKIKNTTGR